MLADRGYFSREEMLACSMKRVMAVLGTKPLKDAIRPEMMALCALGASRGLSRLRAILHDHNSYMTHRHATKGDQR